MNTNSVSQLLVKFNNLNDESIPKWATVLIDGMKILIQEFKGFSDISSKNHKPHSLLFCNSLPVISATNHKLLGLTLDCKRSFLKHLSGIIRHLSSHVPLNALAQLYKIFVWPHLDYCDIVYHIPL